MSYDEMDHLEEEELEDGEFPDDDDDYDEI